MQQYTVTGNGYDDRIGEYNASITVYADNDEEAQAKVWQLTLGGPSAGFDVEEIEVEDPTPYCSACGARCKADCDCGPIAENE